MNFVYRLYDSKNNIYNYFEYIGLINYDIRNVHLNYKKDGYNTDKFVGRFLGANNYYHNSTDQSFMKFTRNNVQIEILEYAVQYQEVISLTLLTEDIGVEKQINSDRMMGYNEYPFNINLIIDPMDVISRYIEYITINKVLFSNDINKIIELKNFYFAYFNDLTMYNDANNIELRKKYSYDKLYLESLLVSKTIFLSVENQFSKFEKIGLTTPVIETSHIIKF